MGKIPEDFRCKMCGACCRAPGYVKIDEDEVQTIALFLGLSAYEFTGSYCRIMSNRGGLSLIERDDGACVFLAKSGGCLINDAKPRQCINFPKKWHTDFLATRCPALADTKLKASETAL